VKRGKRQRSRVIRFQLLLEENDEKEITIKWSAGIVVALLRLPCPAQQIHVPKLERMPEALERSFELIRQRVTPWIGRGQMG
jgi:hypothetical protein